MTDEEINRLLEKNKKASAHLMQAIERMPEMNGVPCWLELLLKMEEPTIMLDKHRLDGKG